MDRQDYDSPFRKRSRFAQNVRGREIWEGDEMLSVATPRRGWRIR